MNLLEANFKNAQREAEKLIREFEYIKPPINPIEIARAIGVDVKFVVFDDPEINEKVSGFFDFDENAIYVNEREIPTRQTFTIAHELGHKILHEDYINSSDYKVLLRQAEMTGKKDPKEQEADAFAANLLVPRFLIDKYRKLANPAELSKLFVVSSHVILHRLKYYG
jgi:Zn-dependent peptidase ImmA (M78 family)